MYRRMSFEPNRPTYNIRHSEGDDEDGPEDLPGREAALSALFDELATADVEHGDVSVTHMETLWYISAHRDGRVIIDRLGAPLNPRHMIPVSKARTLELWRRLIDGDFAALEAEPWRPGYA
jgi:hypothetical protein